MKRAAFQSSQRDSDSDAAPARACGGRYMRFCKRDRRRRCIATSVVNRLRSCHQRANRPRHSWAQILELEAQGSREASKRQTGSGYTGDLGLTWTDVPLSCSTGDGRIGLRPESASYTGSHGYATSLYSGRPAPQESQHSNFGAATATPLTCRWAAACGYLAQHGPALPGRKAATGSISPAGALEQSTGATGHEPGRGRVQMSRLRAGGLHPIRISGTSGSVSPRIAPINTASRPPRSPKGSTMGVHTGCTILGVCKGQCHRAAEWI